MLYNDLSFLNFALRQNETYLAPTFMTVQKTYPCKLAKVIRPKNEKGRWYIEFYQWNATTEKLVRRRSYLGFDRFKSDYSKLNYGKEKCKKINAVLRNSAIRENEFEPTPPVREISEKTTVSDAFTQIITIKYPKERNRKTHLTYSTICARFVEFCDKKSISTKNIKDINKSIAQKYIDYLQTEKKLHANTVLSNHSALRTIFNNLVKREMIEVNPFTDVDKPKETQTQSNEAFTIEEVKILKELISVENPELWNVIQLIYYCFLRPIEISRLTISNFNFETGKIFISGENAKNGKDAFITMPENLKKNFSNKDFLNYPSDYLLFGKDGKPSKTRIGNNWMSRKHSEFLKKVGIADKTLYSWKHSGVVRAYKAGVDLKAIQMQCRHHSIEQTDTYLKSLGFQENTAFKIGMPEI